jgi:hypothetical protein
MSSSTSARSQSTSSPPAAVARDLLGPLGDPYSTTASSQLSKSVPASCDRATPAARADTHSTSNVSGRAGGRAVAGRSD